MTITTIQAIITLRLADAPKDAHYGLQDNLEGVRSDVLDGLQEYLEYESVETQDITGLFTVIGVYPNGERFADSVRAESPDHAEMQVIAERGAVYIAGTVAGSVEMTS